MLVGDVVFKGEVSAQLKKYDTSNAMATEKPIIIYAYSLTTELAFYVINNPVVGILTEESSFATHGANILRCKQSNESQRIVWISGLNIKELSFFEGRIISLHEDGAVTLGENEPFHYWVKEESILNSILSKFSCKSYLMNTLMKHEFRYFKDANVDTVVPLNYAYFNAERTISKLFNSNKTRFH